MPYYPEDNILFIHIPKTGGTALHNYFINKYKITIDKYLHLFDLYYLRGHKMLSLQHLTFIELSNSKYINITSNVKIITIVRNPYTRLISELLWSNHITKHTSREDIYNKILYLFTEYENENTIYDNHIRPQYQFIDGNENITILKHENLNNELKEKLNITDFTSFYNNEYIISKYFNTDSINLINNFYYKDFIIFDYNFIK
jgi:hypothetical protein